MDSFSHRQCKPSDINNKNPNKFDWILTQAGSPISSVEEATTILLPSVGSHRNRCLTRGLRAWEQSLAPVGYGTVIDTLMFTLQKDTTAGWCLPSAPGWEEDGLVAWFSCCVFAGLFKNIQPCYGKEEKETNKMDKRNWMWGCVVHRWNR